MATPVKHLARSRQSRAPRRSRAAPAAAGSAPAG